MYVFMFIYGFLCLCRTIILNVMFIFLCLIVFVLVSFIFILDRNFRIPLGTSWETPRDTLGKSSGNPGDINELPFFCCLENGGHWSATAAKNTNNDTNTSINKVEV